MSDQKKYPNNICSITNSVSYPQNPLPPDFELKTLSTYYLDDIHNLLNHNYIENTQCGVKTIFHKDFLYWYLKYIPPGFVIGLIYKSKLVGIITALFIDMIIYDMKLKVPYVSLLCVHSKLRKLGLASVLIDRMKYMISEIKITYALLTPTKYEEIDDIESDTGSGNSSNSADSSNSDDTVKTKTPSTLTKSFCELRSYAIPINYSKLKSVGFLPEDYEIPDSIEQSNPFHLMTHSDLGSVVAKLNEYDRQFKISHYFTMDSARHFLLPKKNIVYSFGKRSVDGTISDFVTMYVSVLECVNRNKILRVANIAYYYNGTMSLTEMIHHIMAKLAHHDIDQLSFYTTGNTGRIKQTKYLTDIQLDCSFHNIQIPETTDNQISFYPF